MAFFVSLDALDRKTTAAEMRGARKTPRTPEATSPAPSDIAPELWERIKDHPCYSEEAHHYFARMHVAVAPACNIQCNYCNRKYDCANESRPGVVSEKLTPDQALRKVITVANEVPQLSVLGIAGPGDACYDWAKTKATFATRPATIPDIKLCISTNGLALPDHVDELADMNVDHVTITINMVDPEIGDEDLSVDLLQAQALHRASKPRSILHERQMLGLEMLTARGILTKINSVHDPRRQRRASRRRQRRGEEARRLPAQHHAADLRSGAWHALRPDRPARADACRAEGAAGRLRRAAPS